MKARVHDNGSIKTVLVQDDNGDKFITGLEELLDMLDGDLELEVETTNESLKSKLYKHAGLTREVGKTRREIESYNTSEVFPVNDFLKDVELQHDKKVIDNYLLGKDLQRFMIPSLNSDNACIMEEGHDDPVSLVKKAPGECKLPEGDMEYPGREGDTPPNLTREDMNNMVKIDDRRVSVTRKVLEKLIARD